MRTEPLASGPLRMFNNSCCCVLEGSLEIVRQTGALFFSREVTTELCGALGIDLAPSSHFLDGMLHSQHIVTVNTYLLKSQSQHSYHQRHRTYHVRALLITVDLT